MTRFHRIRLLLVLGALWCLTPLWGQMHASTDQSAPPDIMRDYEMLRRQLAQEPNNVAILNSLGILYARAGRLEDAIALWQRALAIDPGYIHLYNNLGSALKSLRRFDEAELIYKTGLAMKPSFWIHYNLGLLKRDQGKPLDATRHFQDCLRLKPGFEPAMRKLQELGHPSFAVGPGSGDTSIGQDQLPGFKPPVALGNLPFPTETSPASPSAPPRRRARRHSIALASAPATVADCVTFLKALKIPADQKRVALTFDDGPHVSLTPLLLDYLKANRVPATFFVLGNRAEAYPDIITRMATEGHEVGNHTWKHISLARQTTADGLTGLMKTADLISGLTGRRCRLVRPPFGHTNGRVRDMIHAQGWHHIMWDADSRDWQESNPRRMLLRVLRGFTPDGIVLFHDIHPGALQVLPILVPALKICGFEFVTVSNLLGLPKETS